MAKIKANGIQIEYDTFGDTTSPALLLIMGLGTQMTAWDEAFCEQLAEQGHYVIRFDNRDIGLSTKFEEDGIPDVIEAMTAAMNGQEILSSYTLNDMADDAADLLSALGVDKAHICGASMGGMIAQTIAIRHPNRVFSLISIMSTTGDPELPPGKPEAMEVLVEKSPTDRDAVIDRAVKVSKIIGSPGFPFDEALIREKAALNFDRSFYPQGQARQLIAVMASGSRKKYLNNVSARTLVIHGSEDPLVPVEGGKDTAESIPGAELLIIDGMGHDLPRGAWPQLINAISNHTQKANA